MIQFATVLLFCLCLIDAHAQEIGSFHTVHIDRMNVFKEGYEVAYRNEIPLRNRLVDVMLMDNEERKEKRLVLISYDLKTGKPVLSDEYDWVYDRKIEKAVGSGNDVLIVSYSFNEEEKRLDLFCQAYDPVDLDELFAPVKIGGMVLAQYRDGSRLGLKFVRSPDGTQQLILYDRIRTKEDDQQLLFCWVLDKTSRNSWSAVYPMDIEADRYLTSGYVVDNSGIVYLCSRERKRIQTARSFFWGYSYTIYRLHHEELIALPLDLPPGRWIATMTLLQDGDNIIGVGFLADENDRKETNEYFRAAFRAADETMILHTGRFTQDVPEPIKYMSAAMGDDGIVFLSGTHPDKFIMTCAVDQGGRLIHSTLVPRKRIVYGYGPAHYLLTDGENALLLMPENEMNIEAYQTGNKLKDNKETKNKVLLVTFGSDGRPSFSQFQPKGVDLLYTSFDRLDRGRTMIFKGNLELEDGGLQPVMIFWYIDQVR